MTEAFRCRWTGQKSTESAVLRFLLVLPALLLLISCASLSEEECRAGTWEDIGFVDGTEGRTPDHLSRHDKACADYGITPDAVRWEDGRQQGLHTYCRPARAWSEGADGRKLRPVCTGPDVERLYAVNSDGLTYHRIGQDISEAQRRISGINQTLAGGHLAPEDRSTLFSERAYLQLEIVTLRAQRTHYRY